MFLLKNLCFFLVLLICIMLAGCAHRMPSTIDNICILFDEKPKWYQAVKRSTARWGGPIHVPMSIIYQESSFIADARPKMNYFLGVVPTGRDSDAYGYAQALKSTWSEYQTAVGSRSPDRDNFEDAVDFVLWYLNVTYQRNGVSKWDAYAQYLNYHEGQGGYSRGSHLNKQWLLKTAKRVDTRAKRFASQLNQCRAELDSKKRGWF
jgi:hypothetical protein